MDKFSTLGSSEKAISILGDTWMPPMAKQERGKVSKTLICVMFPLCHKHGPLSVSDAFNFIEIFGVFFWWETFFVFFCFFCCFRALPCVGERPKKKNQSARKWRYFAPIPEKKKSSSPSLELDAGCSQAS